VAEVCDSIFGERGDVWDEKHDIEMWCPNLWGRLRLPQPYETSSITRSVGGIVSREGQYLSRMQMNVLATSHGPCSNERVLPYGADNQRSHISVESELAGENRDRRISRHRQRSGRVRSVRAAEALRWKVCDGACLSCTVIAPPASLYMRTHRHDAVHWHVVWGERSSRPNTCYRAGRAATARSAQQNLPLGRHDDGWASPVGGWYAVSFTADLSSIFRF